MSSSLSHWPDGALLAARAAGACLRTWGDGYGYALVATGRVAAMVDPVVEPYDVGPMPVILAEAGGRFTDLAGQARASTAAAASAATATSTRRCSTRYDPAESASAALGHRVEQVGPGPGHPRADRADRHLAHLGGLGVARARPPG